VSGAEQALVSDTGDSARLLKCLADAIPQGPHPEPYNVWICVRLDVVQQSIDHIEWLEKGNEEWRQFGHNASRQSSAAQASLRIAIGHLHAMLHKARTADDQLRADTAARDWLASIGSEPA
jgi:hypothetical protein